MNNFDNIKLDDTVVVLKDNEIYRINDVLKLSCFSPKQTHSVCQVILKDEKYKDSILYIYLNKLISYSSCQNRDDISKTKETILLESMLFLDNQIKCKVYNEEYLLVHIRAGDNYMVTGLGNSTLHNILLEKIKKKISENKTIKYILLVTAFHYGHKANSKIYGGTNYIYRKNNHLMNIKCMNLFINNLRTFTKKYNISIEFLSSIDIDKDFISLIKCKNLITSLGGFSNLVARLNILYHQNSYS